MTPLDVSVKAEGEETCEARKSHQSTLVRHQNKPFIIVSPQKRERTLCTPAGRKRISVSEWLKKEIRLEILRETLLSCTASVHYTLSAIRQVVTEGG